MDNWFRSTIMPNIKYKEFLRKHTTEDIVNKMQEDAPANAVAHGGVDMNPDGKKVKKKKENDFRSSPPPNMNPKKQTTSLIDRAKKANKENPRPGSADRKSVG